jgi:hypothetical protein
MSEQSGPKEECLYCHGTVNFPGPCPACSEPLTPKQNRFVEIMPGKPAPVAQGNLYFEFSSNHPHV